MKEKTLSNRFSRLLKHIVKSRTYLVESGLSQRPDGFMRELIDQFRPYIDYAWTDKGASVFILKYYALLREMIPPRERNIIEELETLWLAAKNIFILENQNHKPCKQSQSYQQSLSV